MQCVPEGKLCIDHLQVSSARSQCPVVPGPTSSWTLLLDCLYCKVMTPFLLLWIVSPKWYISWLSLNFPQLQKLHNCKWTTRYVSMGFQRTLYLIEVPSLHLECGRSFAWYWVQR